MITRTLSPRRLARLGMIGCLAAAAVLLAGTAISQPLSNRPLACPGGFPTGQTVGTGLLNALGGPLNSAWQNPTLQSNIMNAPIVQTRIHVPDGCSSQVTDFCLGQLAFSSCSFVYVDITMTQLQGLNALNFTALTSTTNPTSPVINDRNVSEHTNRGPDASIITDGVFAPEGHDAADTAYAIVLLHNTDKGAIVIDLGTKTTLCGVSSNCNPPNIQADNDDVYQLDYSADGTTWTTFGHFRTTGGSGLHTRNTFSDANLPATFSARYVAVYGISGGSNWSISELQIFDTTNTVVSVGKPTVGPVPWVIVDGVPAKPGQSSTDPDVSVVLNHKTGSATALMVDLGKVAQICGSTFACGNEPTIQADNDDTYMLDYSLDGENWTTYGSFAPAPDGTWHSATFPPFGGSGLQTRSTNCSARPDLNSPCTSTNHGPDFSARYLRVYARSGGNTFAVSQIELWDTSGKSIPAAQTQTFPQAYAVATYSPHAYGPEPLYINGEFAPEGTAWDDARYATKLGACTATLTCPPASSSPADPPISSALQIDMTAAFPISRATIPADKNAYNVDYWDGVTLTSTGAPQWILMWPVPAVSDDGLRTRSTTLNLPMARYVRVYATAGDGNYSVSELQIFTPQANTAGTYADAVDSDGFPWSDGRANDGQNFACSYDGTFSTQLGVSSKNPLDGTIIVQPYSSAHGLPISFFVDSVFVNAHCANSTQSGDYNIASATNRTCSMTLVPPVPPAVPYGAPFTDQFQAGYCAPTSISPQGQAIMSYMRFDDTSPDDGGDSVIQFESEDIALFGPNANPNPSDLACSDFGTLDPHIPKALRGVVPPITAGVVRAALNTVLDYHNTNSTTGSLIPFPRVPNHNSPPVPATVAVQCAGAFTGGVDTSPPMTAADITQIGRTAVVNFHANDDVSGVRLIKYWLHGAESGAGVIMGELGSVTVTATGTTTVEFFAIDGAGNLEQPHSIVVTVPPA